MAADVCHRPRIGSTRAERRPRGGRAREEQASRFVGFQRFRNDLRIGGRRGEQRDRISGFPGDPERLTARRQNRHVWGRMEQPGRELGARTCQVLAIVEDQQQTPILEVIRNHVDHGATAFLLKAQHRGDGLRDELWVGQRRELDEPDTVGVICQRLGREAQRQPCLPNPAGPEQRQQPRLRQQTSDLGELQLTADERCRLERQVVRCGTERMQRGKRFAQRRMHELMDLLGALETAQCHAAEIAHRNAGRQPLPNQAHGDLRHQHLAAVRERHDARGAVDAAAEEIVVATLVKTDVHSAANR